MWYVLLLTGGMALGVFGYRSYSLFRLGEMKGLYEDKLAIVRFEVKKLEAQNAGLRQTLKVRSMTDEEKADMLSNGSHLTVAKSSLH